MSCLLRYGAASQLDLELRPAQLAGCFEPVDVSPVESPAAATRDALSRPIEHPPLARSIVPGDRVALAVDRYLSHAPEVLGAVIDELLEHGIDAADVTVVEPEAAAHSAIAASATVPPSRRGAAAVRYEVHEPQNRTHLSYLTNSASGRPIYLNRTLLDADVIVTVGMARSRNAWNSRGIVGGIYPTFSDTASHSRYRNPHLVDRDDEIYAKSQREIETVGRLSGSQFTVQVLPGRGDDVAGIVAGETAAVSQHVEDWWTATWTGRIERRVETVIASLTGAASQTWEHFGRALAASLAIVESGGSIVICTDLETPLGPGMKLLSETDDRDAALAHLRRERPRDLLETLELAQALRRARVYLLSRMESMDVEPLGLIPVDESGDVARFAARRNRTVVLNDAQCMLVGTTQP